MLYRFLFSILAASIWAAICVPASAEDASPCASTEPVKNGAEPRDLRLYTLGSEVAFAVCVVSNEATLGYTSARVTLSANSKTYTSHLVCEAAPQPLPEPIIPRGGPRYLVVLTGTVAGMTGTPLTAIASGAKVEVFWGPERVSPKGCPSTASADLAVNL
jgi:hypothetical protein